MNRTLKALLFLVLITIFIYELSGNNTFSQKGSLPNFEGEWAFEKAEYLERKSPKSDYQMKYRIEKAEGLKNLPRCLGMAVKYIHIGDIARVECVYDHYCGRLNIATLQSAQGPRYLMMIGCEPDELMKESEVVGTVFNMPSVHYQIEKIDERTIAVIYEAICNDNSGQTHSAVKCIMKKIK